MSIKYKIAVLFAVLVLLLMVIASLLVYFFSLKERQTTFQKRLKNRALSTAKVYAGIADSNFSILQKMDTAAVASLYNKSITIYRYDKSPNYLFSDLPNDLLFLEQKVIDRARSEKQFYFIYKNKNAVAIHQVYKNRGFIVAVAAFDLDGYEYLTQLRQILFITVVLAAVLSFLTGLLFAGSLIRPIKRISGEVNLITSKNISQRIRINKERNELTNLAQTFNQLLDRLEDSFTIQRRFISNASHELSTPLTSISSQLDVAMQKNRSAEEYKEVIQSVYEDIRELQQLSQCLLDISKTGSQGSIDLYEVRIDEILLKVIADVKKQNKNYKITIGFEIFPEDEKLLSVFGNTNLLYIALKNIIDNGCKYSENHESVVTALFEQTCITIQVRNSGDIIAEADIQNIFQPFFRTESAKNKRGFGLGLTLTKRILSLHKAVIKVESSLENGTIFSVQIPNILSDF